MRDLDQLQEQDPDERGRSFGVWLVVTLLLLAVCAGLFVVWSRGEKAGTPAEDPLDRLAQLGRAQPERKPDAGKSSERRKQLEPEKLTFERALTEQEDRPEVIAALAAAAREEERLAAAQAELATDDERSPAARSGDVRELRAVPAAAPIPAGLAASAAASKLEKSAKHDKLVAAAMPQPARGAARAAGGGDADGEFMLQVISYGARVQADAFTNKLREHGHDAFVEVSEVSGRGRTYRVRIGPFKSKAAADTYRREFEEREHMNTIVVRKED